MSVYDFFHLTINGELSTRYADLVTPDDMDIIQPKYYEYDDVLVKDGTDRKFENAYSDYTCSYNFYLIEENQNLWGKRFALLKQWLYGFNTESEVILQESTDLEWFKYVSKIEIDSIDRSKRNYSNVKVKFTFKPYDYAIAGQYHYSLSEIEYNSWYRCEPIFILTNTTASQRTCTLKITNDVSVCTLSFTVPASSEAQVNVQDGIIRCYKNDTLTGLLGYNGSVKNMVLENGVNDVSVTSGFTVKVIPNWRRL